MRRSHIGITVNAVTIAFTVLVSLVLGKYLLLPAIRLTHGHENLIGFLLGLGAISTCIQTLMFSAAFIRVRHAEREGEDEENSR